MHTTDLYKPSVYTQLRLEGCVLVRWQDPIRAFGVRAVLFDQQGNIELQDGYGWVRNTAESHGIPLTERLWTPCQPHGLLTRDALFLTPFGARTVADALEMERLASAYNAKKAATPTIPLPYDNYTNAEDTFIERNGFSSNID